VITYGLIGARKDENAQEAAGENTAMGVGSVEQKSQKKAQRRKEKM
jgi:hypothetical protein